MSETQPKHTVRRADEIEYESVDAAEGMSKGVLIGEAQGAPHFAMRRFTLDPGAEVPAHTNEVEHEQYVLAGAYTVGIREVSETPHGGGDSEERSSSNHASGRNPRAEAAGEGEEYEVSAGDALLIPAGAEHWYRNDGDEEGAFVCVVPNGDDEIRLVE